MILITGAAGYIGSHTAINFLNNGYNVVAFDNLSTGHIEIINELKHIGNIDFTQGDLCNKDDIEKVFEKYDIDAVVHFAAFSLVEESVKNPSKYYRNNVLGTINLLDSMVKHGVKKFVFSSTCATYGEPQYVPIDEKHPQKPINPYGNSKLCIEMILKDYDKAYGLKSICLRYFNVSGCDELCRVGEWHDNETHLIPNVLKSAIENNKEFKLYGNDYDTPDGTCIRDYVNVEDLAEAHRLAYTYIKENNKSDVFNIGSEHGNSVKEVFEACENVLNKNIKIKIVERREGDPSTLYADSSKAKKLLKWASKKSLKDSIRTAYAWELKLEEFKKGQ